MSGVEEVILLKRSAVVRAAPGQIMACYHVIMSQAEVMTDHVSVNWLIGLDRSYQYLVRLNTLRTPHSPHKDRSRA